MHHQVIIHAEHITKKGGLKPALFSRYIFTYTRITMKNQTKCKLLLIRAKNIGVVAYVNGEDFFYFIYDPIGVRGFCN